MAFVEAASLGSFSAAARKLRKSQSTISTAIANLEADLNLVLFDRNARYPVLTPEGQRILMHVQDILVATERLEQTAIRLSDHIEPRLTLAFSDTYQPTYHEALLTQLEQRYPEIELEYFFAENKDVVDLLQKGRVHLGVVEGSERYPPDISSASLPEQTAMAIYVNQEHPLANYQDTISYQHLKTYRELRLKTLVTHNNDEFLAGHFWSAPSYLILLELAELGFGWAKLPRWLSEKYNLNTPLVELPVQGWPKLVSVDVIWSNLTPPGAAGSWVRDKLISGNLF